MEILGESFNNNQNSSENKYIKEKYLEYKENIKCYFC